MKKLKAEMWDKMQFLFRNYYDRTMHSIFYYGGKLDEKLLGTVYYYVVKRIPILHSTFHNNPIRPFWTLNEEFSLEEFFRKEDTDDLEGSINDFVSVGINEKARVQLQVRLFRSTDRDALCIITNHMCFDGGDLKVFNSLIVEGYNQVVSGKELSLEVKSGTRSAEQVYSFLSEEDKKYAKSLYKNISSVESKVIFPFAEERADDKCRIIRYKLEKEVFDEVRKKGKANGATVNDVLLAAYIRAIFKACQLEENAALTVPCMFDLRRYMKDGKSFGFTNMTGFMPCCVENGIGRNMEEALEIVKKALEFAKKDKFTGLYSLPLLKLAYTLFPHFIAEIAIKIGYTNPYIGMSNIGIVKAADYTMGEAKLVDAWYTGAIKYKPYMQLALTTFEGVITFSIAIRGNEKDDKIFTDFLKDICDNLKEYASLANAN